jgi:hypothetical protein
MSALPVICFPEPLFALSHMHNIAQHCTYRLLATLCSPSGLQVCIWQRGNVPVRMLSHHSLAWILSLVLSAGSPEWAAWKGMVLPYSVFLVLGAAALARAVAHNSYLCLSEYSNAVL